jgi:peptide/nickel transport system substrate-binding protein
VFDDQLNPTPILVTEIPSKENGGISEDDTTITLTLRDDIVWSDDTPITSADFVFTYEMAMDPNNTVASQYPYDQLESIEAPDERTVVLSFADPFAPWLSAGFFFGVLPEHVLAPVFEAEGTIDNAEWNRAPTVGCGPFVFDEWESGSFARFVASDNYWAGRPNIDEVFFQFVPDDAAQIAALVSGEADLGTFFSYSDIPTLQEAGIEIVTVQSGYNEGIFFYQGEDGHPGVKELAVRQAIAYATDRYSITEDLLLGLTEPATTYWHNTAANDPSLEPFPYDPDEARRLLDEAGWVDSNSDGTRDKDGVELVLAYGTTTREIRQDTQAVLQQNLAEVGIGVELFNADFDTFFSSYGAGGPAASGEYDMYEFSNVANFPDPDTAEWLCSEMPSDEYPDGVNWQQVCDEDLQDLFIQQATTVDPAARQEIFHQITRYIFDQVYWLGLWYDPDTFGISGRLQNVRFSGSDPFFNIREWDIEEAEAE